MSSRMVGAGLIAGALTMGGLVAGAAAQGAAKVDAGGIYKSRCAMCHGPRGDSKLPGMSFTDGQWKHGTSIKEIGVVIRDGVEGTAMLPFKEKLKDPEIAALAAYVRALDPKLKPAGS